MLRRREGSSRGGDEVHRGIWLAMLRLSAGSECGCKLGLSSWKRNSGRRISVRIISLRCSGTDGDAGTDAPGLHWHVEISPLSR